MSTPAATATTSATDSSTPEASAISSGQSIKAPLSSIEHDPNNPPPESPSVQEAPPIVQVSKREFKWQERVRIQLPFWWQHFYNFRYRISTATFIAIVALLFYVFGYIIDMKALFFGIAFGLSALCFSFIWLMIDFGPPFQSTLHGEPIRPDYYAPSTIDDDSEFARLETAARIAEFGVDATSEENTDQQDIQQEELQAILEFSRQTASGGNTK